MTDLEELELPRTRKERRRARRGGKRNPNNNNNQPQQQKSFNLVLKTVNPPALLYEIEPLGYSSFYCTLVSRGHG